MSQVYLNGQFMPMSEAKISPMDRGFLFGDGIYEVIPVYSGKSVGLGPHLARMQAGLDAIELKLHIDHEEWRGIVDELAAANESENLGIYIQISRGADSKRNHAMPVGIEATRFAFAFEIAPPPIADKALATRFEVSATRDLRWQRCNIKSTSLLGNVMHYQHGHSRGHHETLLFNSQDELTEAAACNVFIVKDGVISTPLLDHQKLPGITRLMLLDMLKKHSSRTVQERVITRDEVDNADEVWLTSSSKEVAPVVAIEGRPVGNGEVGDVWLEAETLFSQHRYEY
ncbi:aminotransferase class IV [Congregibacter litoralis]|uniref:Aminodeoxychorismate lyase n=1 Tax=Congregibacter litoralis KT71 TaxID=314285 RepID=A4A411_9GAMM|nr:aminotransferase class IV [Congregibacter litoralis]EAQ99434.1 Branched-chain amino acid aminotransferase/4-amino-4-deoxychorismate lyase [Congregibacter litoralis KT71]